MRLLSMDRRIRLLRLIQIRPATHANSIGFLRAQISPKKAADERKESSAAASDITLDMDDPRYCKELQRLDSKKRID